MQEWRQAWPLIVDPLMVDPAGPSRRSGWGTLAASAVAGASVATNSTNASGVESVAEEWLCQGEPFLPTWDGGPEAFPPCFAYALPVASNLVLLLLLASLRGCARRGPNTRVVPQPPPQRLPRLYHAVLLLAHAVALVCSLAEVVRRSVHVSEGELAVESFYHWTLPLSWAVSLCELFPSEGRAPAQRERYAVQAFWTFNLAASMPLLYNQLTGLMSPTTGEFSTVQIDGLFAQMLAAVASWIYVLRWSLAEEPTTRKGRMQLVSCPMQGAGPLNRLMFNWCWPLVKLGSTRPLELTDVWAALAPDAVAPNYLRFQDFWDPTKPWLTSTLLAMYWRPFVVCGLMQLASAVLDFVGPVMLSIFVQLASSQPDPAIDGQHMLHSIVCVCALTLARALSAFLQQHTQFEIGRLGLRVTGALKTAVYVKLLRLSAQERQARSAGDVVNLLTVDVQRVTASTMGLWNALVLPAQIVVAMVLLWQVMGASMLAGLVGMLAVLSANYVIAAYQKTGVARLGVARLLSSLPRCPQLVLVLSAFPGPLLPLLPGPSMHASVYCARHL